jgi:transmembrane sensor
MSEPNAEIRTALDQIDTRWDEQRAERGLLGAQQKQRRRSRNRGVLASLVVVAALASAVALGTSKTEQRETQLAAVEPAARRMQLTDGSEVALLAPETHVVVRAASTDTMQLELAGGHASFDVVHIPTRVFRVVSGEVTVEVLGTAFELERQGARTHVAVTRGRVAVSWKNGRTELAAGEAGWFPKPAQAEAVGNESAARATTEDTEPAPENRVAPTSAPGPAPAHVTLNKSHASSTTSDGWREPAERGDFTHAYELLRQTKRPPADDVEELLLAADTARLSGHPEAALPFLRKVVNDHPDDSRAPLAAFTLGGVLMQQLGRPGEAESAYGKARALALQSSLAQDALARQVEAAHRAGDAERARSLASEYLRRYPSGRRVNAVRGFGGLDRE